MGNGGSLWQGGLGTGACSTGQEPVSGGDSVPTLRPWPCLPQVCRIRSGPNKGYSPNYPNTLITGNLTRKGWYLFTLASDINDKNKAKELFMEGSL